MRLLRALHAQVRRAPGRLQTGPVDRVQTMALAAMTWEYHRALALGVRSWVS